MDNSSSTPLADYFWVAGVESLSYHEPPPPSPSKRVDATIREVSDENEGLSPPTSPRVDQNGQGAATNGNGVVPRSTARHSRQNSQNRLSKLSAGAERLSIATVEELETGTRSNRSSVTIRPGAALPITPSASGNHLANGDGRSHSPMTGFDFDTALLKFASEREDFLDDLSFSAGAKVAARPPMVSPRTERIKADEAEVSGRMSPLRSLRGSIRRKMSFKDMSSTRRQPNASRAVSVRTAKRLSNYNSVIPPPEPINADPDMHPLKRRFEPTLLDRYPPKDAGEDLVRRGRFPDYVPMFAFPNDIQVVSADDRPRPTWHGFTMTSEDNSKIYGITVILWTAVEASAAEEIETKCEAWRQHHMPDEEREFAASLGVRLAAERAHLSEALATLPTVASGSVEREELDEEISAIEEKISLMTDLLRPLRHGAASKIDGLTAGESGLWTPRAYGILGRDVTKISFWKEWLRAVIVPMTDGAVLRVPPTSPKVGRWQPLERYVVNLCMEAFSPLSSKTQVELGVRELRLYARKEAENELPGSRNIDLYALFRCLSLENIVALFEYAMSESRIIFLSSHTAMLHLACHAVVSLLYPLRWASVFIPILPARLLAALDAPCPYIVGVERRFDNIEWPEDDFVLVDLDKDTIDATSQPTRLPRQIRRKLLSLLQVAAPHTIRYGVATGPPPYAMECFPYDAFSAENESVYVAEPDPASLGKWVSQSSSTFGEVDAVGMRPPIFNAFMAASKKEGPERPMTAKSNRTSPPSSVSPISINYPPVPGTAGKKTDSVIGGRLQKKRSGHFDSKSRRSSSFGVDMQAPPAHKPSITSLNGHGQNQSISGISMDYQPSYGGGYAPSTYAQSTLAASTIMPAMLIQPVMNSDTTMWVEGHCFEWTPTETASTCTLCDDKSEGDGLYKCAGCGTLSHARCLGIVCIVCPEAFHAERVRAAFVRCQASLLFTYRKYLERPNKQQKANGQMYAFEMDSFIRSLPHDQQDYVRMMRQTQAFDDFIHEREKVPGSTPTIRLFDEIILAKKARGRPSITSGLSRLSTIRASHGLSFASMPKQQPKVTGYLGDTSDHMWRTASVPVPTSRFQGDYRSVTTRVPTRLDPALMKEPRSIQGVPRPEQRGSRNLIRKQVPSISMLSRATESR